MRRWIRIGAVALGVLMVSIFMIEHPVVRRNVRMVRMVRHALGLDPPETIYISQFGGVASSGNACNTHTTQAATFFNTLGNWANPKVTGKIGPGDTVYLCGTFTGTANSTMLTAQGSGSSGSPITILADSNTNFTAPYWASSAGGSTKGAITLGSGLSWITLDGNNLQGVIQNSANGSRLANAQASTGISGFNMSNVIIKNWTISNLYVQVQGDPQASNPGGITDGSVIRAIDFNGSNVTVSGHRLDACGWCLFDSYGNGDTVVEISFNEISHFNHGILYATANAFASTHIKIHDNNLHDTDNWANTAGSGGSCSFHDDGLHVFGVSGSSIDDFGYYNNWLHGSWGTCPTGHVFVEGGSSLNAAHMKNSQWFNNVMTVENQKIVNTNGWFNISSGDSGVQEVYSNTVKGTNATDNTLCLTIQNASSVNMRDNVIDNCGDPIQMKADTLGTVGTNYYGNSCHNFGNCFDWNGSFKGSFSAWKTACACDSTSFQNDVLNLNPDGSPTATSPVLGAGANLTSLASGNLTSITTSTTKGNTITGVARPPAGSWTDGAYQFGTAPVINLTPSPVAFGSQIDGTTSAAITVTVTNNGTATETLSSPYFSITGPNAADFANAGTGTCANGGTIAVSATCTVKLTFTPSAPGSRSATITILGTALGAASMTGTGIAISPTVSLSPTSIAFGNQTTGTSSGNHSVSLTNTGTAVLNITSIGLTGTNASEFSTNGSTCGSTLAVSASCTINVVFSPLTAAAKTANLTFTTNASTSPDNVALTGTGVAPLVPNLSVSPSPAAFGNQPVGVTSSVLTVTVTNSGPGSQVFSNPYFTITGPNAADFTNTGAGTCSNGGTLGVASCTAKLTFIPSGTGAESATLTFNGTVSTSDSLTGTGIAPTVSLNPTSIAFGNQTSGTSSGNSAVTLTNSGTGPLTITSIALTGANPTEFSTNSSTCGSTLAAAASCSLNVVFSPTAVASRSASLTFTTNASTSPDNVTLTGTGIAPLIPVLSFSPSPGAFGNQTVATTSAPITITVSNVGTGTEVLSTPYWTLSGTNASNFANPGTGSCTNGGSIAASSSCTVKLTFTPSATGARVGTLTINGTTIASDSLTGTGVAATNPTVSLTPGSLNFGNQNIGTSSNNSLITLQNTGTASLTITSIAVTGTNATEFSINLNTCAASLAISASCTLNAVFMPATAGAKSASVTFTTNASTSPDAVTMTGTGLTPSPSPTPAPAITIVSILPPGSVILTSGSFAVTPRYTQVTPQGCTIDGVTFQNPCKFSMSCGNCSKNTTVRWNGSVVSQSYQRGTITASVPLSLIPIPTVSTDYSLSLSN